jgi:hypothetical protein
MNRKTILILEDNEDRTEAFRRAVASLKGDFSVKVWRDAPSMVKALPSFIHEACLFSLDHDLNPTSSAAADPGTGLEVAEYLAKQAPVCPVLIHSSNYEKSWSMHNELRFAGWRVDRISPLGDDWVECMWLPKIRALLNETEIRDENAQYSH